MSRVRVYGSFEDLPEAYEALFEDAGQTFGLFSCLPWFCNLTATVREDNQRLRIYGVESGEPGREALMALPMRHEALPRGLFRVRTLRALANFYTSLFNPVTRTLDQSMQEHLTVLANAITADKPRWDAVDLSPMEAGSHLFLNTIAAFRRSGMAVQTYFCFANWYLEVDGRSFQAYFDSLPSRLKNTVQRKARQLEKSGRARIEILSDQADVDRGAAAYEKVYSSSWKGKEAYPLFMPGLIRTCAEQGWLRLGIVWLDDAPIAVQLWIVVNGVASIYKLAYDEQHSRWSAGTILTARLMQHAIDIDQVREVDYLTGDDAYKRDWMSKRRERHGIIAFNLRTVNGVIGACRHIGGKMIKQMLRQ